jgi:putative ABC transport system permease protein
MAMRGVGRNPRRTTYTILGVILSLMLVLVSWGMIDTVRHLMDRQFVDIQREDARVYFTGPTDASVIAGLAGVEGIEAVEPVLEVPVAIEAGPKRYETGLIAMSASTQMRRFYTPDGMRIDLPARGLLLGRAMQSQLDVEPGDPVAVTIQGAAGALTLQVAAFIDEPLGTLAYASFEGLSAAAQTTLPAGSAAIRYAAGYDGATVRSSLIDMEMVAAFEDTNAVYDMYQQFLTLFYVFVGVMLLFGGAMAFALIFSSMSVNIAERSREVGTLLAVGTDRSTVSRLITVENLVVAMMGVIPGLFAGYWIAKYAMASFGSDMFSFDLYIAPVTYVASAAAILGVSLLSQWPGIRALRRIDIPKIVKERSV